ncbi:conserved hypothetical protein [Shewanella sediminis HAW-EB3]|uniref:WD40 domain protein beta Propeller n=1 Tax=Shewanella sediminis (strain HAW-EB3) TaxID=425104 RepID=A8G0J8_SHESH|nr:PD40 domain-containing protein [Shewanella sediminis]ABV38621.1 conserved hypothetical protein [Shewanella sediminis HAW-EB3]
MITPTPNRNLNPSQSKQHWRLRRNNKPVKLISLLRLSPLPLLASIIAMPSLASGYDIWLYPLQFDAVNVSWQLGEAKAITNREGYDNQPAFTSDNQAILFASDRGGAHNDIYQYHLNYNHINDKHQTEDDKVNPLLTQVTDTEDESEYSPQAAANGIRYVVEQGVPHQSVWIEETGFPRKRAINSMIPSGYYAHHPELGTLIWARYAYSLYFEPIGDTADERHFVVANAGRSIHAIPSDKAFSYLHKQPDGDRVIKRFAPDSGSHTPLISIGNGSEDYGWSSNGWIFNIEANQLRAWPLTSKTDHTDQILQWQSTQWQSAQWQAITQLEPPTLAHHSPSRVAISPDNRHIAIVWAR